MKGPFPKFFTRREYEQLVANGRQAKLSENFDPRPVVKLFLPEGGATWLLSELDPDVPGRGFGLCDLGLGCAELGYVSVIELSLVRSRRLRLPIERDRYFKPDKSLSAYAAEARGAGRIIA